MLRLFAASALVGLILGVIAAVDFYLSAEKTCPATTTKEYVFKQVFLSSNDRSNYRDEYVPYNSFEEYRQLQPQCCSDDNGPIVNRGTLLRRLLSRQTRQMNITFVSRWKRSGEVKERWDSFIVDFDQCGNVL
jgi:hypothetical protein